MRSFLRFIIVAPLLLFMLGAHAGQKPGAKLDPIGWSMTGSLPSVGALNQSYALGFSFVNNLPFAMKTPLFIVNNSTPASEVIMSDGCSGTKLAPNGTCSISLLVTPKSVGTKSVSVFMEYGSNKVQVPRTPLMMQIPADASLAIQGIAIVGLPSNINSNIVYPIEFQFTNNTTSTVSGIGIAPTPGNSPTFTQTATSCGATLAPHASCTVSGTFTTAATSGTVTVGVTMSTSGGNGSATTSSIINNSISSVVRSFTFVNNTGNTVWYGFVSSAVNGNACGSNSDCAQGSLCNTSANGGAGLCFYATPVPTNGSYQLANGATGTALLPDYGLQYVWSGNFAARTGTNCATGTCDTGDCQSGGGNNNCPVGTGFAQPATLGEMTLLRNSVDSYDVSVINGLNVGVEVTPTTTGTFAAGSNPPYNCQSPGNPAAVPALGLGACTWTGFTQPSTSYVYVKPPASPTVCTTDAQCTVSPNTRCGLTFNASTNTISKVCGQFLGYLTANQVCSFAHTSLTPGGSSNPGDPYFNCDTSVGGSLSQYSLWGLFACVAQPNLDLGTCYNSNSTTNCCGCVNWNTVGATVPATTGQCVQTDSSWVSNVQPTVTWLKTTCPTVYTYQFDDKASSFTCMDINAGHTTNTVNYTITFLPTA